MICERCQTPFTKDYQSPYYLLFSHASCNNYFYFSYEPFRIHSIQIQIHNIMMTYLRNQKIIDIDNQLYFNQNIRSSKISAFEKKLKQIQALSNFK